ncbi:hypothetical protein GCM10008955_20670 [Deinococcus malanensis]|uniref:Uncharacterized protein n=1 Tax=Deinococcus malanensis TaxID=1706855 RepID=A0ABQ2EUV0_9DEIO|nr:hypothetical protein GCM10008955_20670 [Deinococcus malanensis]
MKLSVVVMGVLHHDERTRSVSRSTLWRTGEGALKSAPGRENDLGKTHVRAAFGLGYSFYLQASPYGTQIVSSAPVILYGDCTFSEKALRSEQLSRADLLSAVLA